MEPSWGTTTPPSRGDEWKRQTVATMRFGGVFRDVLKWEATLDLQSGFLFPQDLGITGTVQCDMKTQQQWKTRDIKYKWYKAVLICSSPGGLSYYVQITIQTVSL